LLNISQIPVLNDNYIYILTCQKSGETAVVDPAIDRPVVSELERLGVGLDKILNTHHHFDHVGANKKLQAKYGSKIYASYYDINKKRIPGEVISVSKGEFVEVGESRAEVIELPGHTLGHIAYFFREQKLLFCGDVLFSHGCGRLFEGSAQQMFDSISILKRLPPDTLVHCAHEYTQKNLDFSKNLDQKFSFDHESIYVKKLREKISNNQPTVPFYLEDELSSSPFLTAESVETFAEVRKLRDSY